MRILIKSKAVLVFFGRLQRDCEVVRGQLYFALIIKQEELCFQCRVFDFLFWGAVVFEAVQQIAQKAIQISEVFDNFVAIEPFVQVSEVGKF